MDIVDGAEKGKCILMKAIVCEMCGSRDLTKVDGLYVCQACGTKYSPEEAKKLMVDVSVKLDDSDELSNLWVLARRAKETDNADDGEKYYGQLTKKNPLDWEAYFYSIYYRAINCEDDNIENAIDSVCNSYIPTFKLIMGANVDEDSINMIVKEIGEKVFDISKKFDDRAYGICKRRENELNKNSHWGNEMVFESSLGIDDLNICFCEDIMEFFGDMEVIVKETCTPFLKKLIEGEFLSVEDAKEFINIVLKYDEQYHLPEMYDSEKNISKAEEMRKELLPKEMLLKSIKGRKAVVLTLFFMVAFVLIYWGFVGRSNEIAIIGGILVGAFAIFIVKRHYEDLEWKTESEIRILKSKISDIENIYGKSNQK